MYRTKSMVHYATSMRLRFVYYRDTTVKKNMQNMIGVKFTLFAEIFLYKMYKKFAPKILKSIKFGENMSLNYPIIRVNAAAAI